MPVSIGGLQASAGRETEWFLTATGRRYRITLVGRQLVRRTNNPMPRLICANCSCEYDARHSLCPGCGHDRTTSEQTFAPSVIVAGPDPQTGRHAVNVADPSGVRSKAITADDVSKSLKVSGANGIGRPGEARAVHTLEDRLTQDGYDAKATGGDDAKGIDRWLVVDGERFVLQITVAPQDSEFWRNAKHSSVSMQIGNAQVVSWLRYTVVSKSSAPARHDGPVVLAIDVRHAAVAAVPEQLAGYLAQYLSPAREFGFASVWVIGPTAEYCLRLGEGRP